MTHTEFNEYLLEAKSGSAYHQSLLGEWYILGHSPNNDSHRDREKAKYWLTKAVNGKDYWAALSLGEMLLYDDNKKTVAYATRLITKAADHGIPGAKYRLWICYHHGIGVDVNKTLANEYLKEAIAAAKKEV